MVLLLNFLTLIERLALTIIICISPYVRPLIIHVNGVLLGQMPVCAISRCRYVLAEGQQQKGRLPKGPFQRKDEGEFDQLAGLTTDRATILG